MQVAAMGFSSYGNRFVTVSGEPDYRLKVWDLKTGKLLVEATLDFIATDVVYHPHNKDEFVVMGENKVVFWQIEELYQKYILSAKTPNLLGLVPKCCGRSHSAGHCSREAYAEQRWKASQHCEL